jgi:hypothetical protein
MPEKSAALSFVMNQGLTTKQSGPNFFWGLIPKLIGHQKFVHN